MVFCCVGGGGLLSGVGVYIKTVRPDVKIVGVEAADAASMTESLLQGERVNLDRVGFFADGAAVKLVGEETFRLSQLVVDEMVTVSTDEICGAIKDGFLDTRTVEEKRYFKTQPEPSKSVANCFFSDKFHTNSCPNLKCVFLFS